MAAETDEAPNVNRMISAQLEAISAKVDASRLEGDRRGDKHSKELELVRGGLDSLARRVTQTERAISDIRGSSDTITVPTQADIERAAELGSAVGQLIRIEQSVNASISEAQTGIRSEMVAEQEKLREDFSTKLTAHGEERTAQHAQLKSELKGQLDVQDRVQRGVVNALGLDYAALSAPPPTDPGDAAKHALAMQPKVTMKTLSREQKIAAGATVLVLVLEVVTKLLH